MNIKDILKKIEEGKELTDADIKAIGEARKSIEEGEVPKDSTFSSSSEFTNAFDQLIQLIGNSPQHQQRIAQAAQQRKGDKVADGLNLLLKGSDILTSINQIRQSDEGITATQRPGMPSVPKRDPMLMQRLRQANRAMYNQSSELAPAKAGIQDQYNADLSTARTASTGQASAYGSMAQVAANRRNRANLNLAGIAQDQANTARSQYDNLLGLRQGEMQDNFRNRLGIADRQTDMYYNDLDAYGRLGAAGRQNLRSSLGNIVPSIGNMIGNLPVKAQQPTTQTGFGAEIDKYANDIEGNLFGRFQTPFMNNNYRTV